MPDTGPWVTKTILDLEAQIVELKEALHPFAVESIYVPDTATDMHLNYRIDGAEVSEESGIVAQDFHHAALLLRLYVD